MSRPRILYLTHNCPHAPSYGGQLRALHIGRLLQQCGEVRLVLLHVGEVDPNALAKSRAEFNLAAVMPVERELIHGARNRLRHEFDPWFLNTHGRSLSPEHVTRIADLAASHDVVWFNGIGAANTIGISRWPSSVLDLEDVLSQFYRSAAKNAKSWKERVLNWRRLWLWKRREAVLLERFSLLTVCSEADRRYLGSSERIHTIPNGFEPSAAERKRCPLEPPRIGFIGNLTYAPNYEGVAWFIKNVWPRIKNADGAVRLRLVGASTDSENGRRGPDIDGLGWVEDTSTEIATWSLMIVPIHMGAGTRLKLVEAFSRKCPVVATTLGAFGYEVTSGEELLLADQPEEFARACLSILRDARRGEQLVNRAWQKFVERWTWAAIGPRVAAAVDHCLSLSERKVSGTRAEP